ncbi:hypothetical protein [Nocardia mikamii]|uniref:hypothetical protein n=1 Tax=Nocardia mikamii TaxID=508464 RepID=UPI000AFBEBCC|nr:hypothetical protein [Nocardia mikamii]
MSDQYHDRGFERTSVRRRSGAARRDPHRNPVLGSAEPGTADAARLDLAIVLGTQSLTP